MALFRLEFCGIRPEWVHMRPVTSVMSHKNEFHEVGAVKYGTLPRPLQRKDDCHNILNKTI
jgi:hypothetical protein